MVIANDHFGKECLAKPELAKKEPKRKQSSGKKSTTTKKVETTVATTDSGCTYKYRKNHKTLGGQVCGRKPVMNGSTLCYEHGQKKLLAKSE